MPPLKVPHPRKLALKWILFCIDRAYNTNIPDIVITGDFNFNMRTNGNNKIKDLIQNYNLEQLINEDTHFTENSSSLIDLILVRNSSNILMSGVADSFIPDQIRFHCPILVLLKFLRPSTKSFKRKIRNYERADFTQFRENLISFNLEEKLVTENIDDNVVCIQEALDVACENSVPSKIVTIRPDEPPWITCHIKNLIRKRKRAFRKFKKTSNQSFWEKFKALRNKVVNEIRLSKTNYFDKLEDILSKENVNSKLFWKTSKQILGVSKTSHTIPTLKLDNKFAENNADKANMLNEYFSSQSVVNDINKTLPPRTDTNNQLNFITISEQEVKDVLDNLNVTKACGPDLISPRLLKEGASVLSKPLATVFNRSLLQGSFPSNWKDANVTAIHKKEDKSVPSNYRPISLLSQLGKVMERCVHKHIFNYISENSLLTPFQSGFIQGDSTTFQLLHTYHSFLEAVDSGKEVRVVFCDISKAFDRVWHKGLLHKLACMGISGSLLQWFQSYLSNRRQRVVLNGVESNWADVLAGVPQGSILGPLLFLIYINDIVNNIRSSIRLFADDTSIYIIIDDPQTAAFILNSDLDTINVWANDWLVDFNPTKTTSLLISRRQLPIAHPPLEMNNVILNETTSHRHLGLTFSNTCNWSDHIQRVTNTAWSRLHLMRALKIKVNRQALEKMYFAFIRPLLEYSDSVWDNCSNEAKRQLDSIHHEAARIITGGTKPCSLEKLLADLGWDSMQERRTKHKLVIFYKIINNLTPNYLQEFVPPLVQDGNPYRLRNSSDIRTIHTNTNLFYNSFYPSTIREWNNLEQEIKDASSVASFKYQLNRETRNRAPPKYYSAGSRKGQILHARLRMQCSSLNADLYRKNIIPSPSCSCGGFESAYHFFYVCPQLTAVRESYLGDVLRNHTTHQLLCGKPEFTNDENVSLFLKVQDFIIKSKRFEQ